MNCKPEKYKENSRKYFNIKSKDFYNTLEGKYSKMMYIPLIEKLHEGPFVSLLDIGCGTGDFLSNVFDKFNAKISGIDISPGMIGKARELLGENADLRVGDSEKMPWNDNSFDIITCNASFHHYPNPIGVIEEMKRILKPKGRIIISDPCESDIVRFFTNILIHFINSGDVRMYSPNEIIDMLKKSGFVSIGCEKIKKFFIISAYVK